MRSVWSFFLFFLVLSSPHAVRGTLPANEEGASYTVNFSNVAITEYLKFVSRIAKVNFIYNENELNFNVTVVSEEPATSQSIMAALIHVLRMNGMNLIDEGNNLVITTTGTAS
ncbi:MAG: hypothetical protein VXZ72_04845, partial [Chlamydiota bacterium]|nr:hypothetical protein [Chlamydiota bacterium]